MKTLVKNPRFWLALLCAAMLLLGYATTEEYGIYFDEATEQIILKENLKEYALRLGGPNSRAAAYYDEQGISAIHESIEIDHGQCAYYPIAFTQNDPYLFHRVWHLHTWTIFVAGCWALYGVLREMKKNRVLSFIGMMLLFLSPRFFGEGHYNNKDMVLLALILCVFYLGMRFLNKPGMGRGLLFSLAGAMAANTKIVGMAPWGLIGLAAVYLITVDRRWSKRMAATAAVTVGSFCLFYALLTPAMWSDPASFMVYLFENAASFSRWTGVVWFRGLPYDHRILPLPRYYLPYMMLISLPLYFFPLVAVGQCSALAQVCRKPKEPASLLLLCATVFWALFVGYAMIRQPLMYNGWRHFYFVAAGLTILAAQGVDCLWRYLQKKKAVFRRLCAACCALCLCATAVGLYLNHPYQYAYYNPLAGEDVEHRMELDCWGVGALQAVRTLVARGDELSYPLELSALDPLSQMGLDCVRDILTPSEREEIYLAPFLEAMDPFYVYTITTYENIFGVEIPEGYHELFAQESYGNVISRVYEMD